MTNGKPVMILIAGINGAGKTTFYYEQIKPFLDNAGHIYPFVNADELERARYPQNIGQYSIEMGKLAAKIRCQYLETGQSFITETVFSHPSKIQLIHDAKTAGFAVILNHIHVSSAELAFKRVLDRVSAGGHNVPKATVLNRYQRTTDNIQKACVIADQTFVWDNSKQAGHTPTKHHFVMAMINGKVTKLAHNVPDWACQMYSTQIEAFEHEI